MITDAVFNRWTALTAIAIASSACGIEHAVVAALDSGGTAGVENSGSAGEGQAGQVSTLTDPQTVDDTRAAPSSGAGGSGGSGVGAATSGSAGSSGSAGTSGSGGAPDSERTLGGAAGIDQRTVSGTTGDCLNVTEPADASGGAGGDIDSDATLACACLGQTPIRWCGMDGVTYEAPCEDDCPAVDVACLHECPCDAMDAAESMMFWFTPDSDARDACTEGFACIGFSSETGALRSSCITLGE